MIAVKSAEVFSAIHMDSKSITGYARYRL